MGDVMPLNAATLASAHRMLPDARTVTLTPKNPAAADITGITGYRRPWSKAEMAQLGVIGLESDRATFLLATETLAGNVPVNGWWITDDESVSWIIQSVTRELADSIIRCPCIKTV